MYDGWANLIGPAVFSGIITLAVWNVPQLRKQGTKVLTRQRKIAIAPNLFTKEGVEYGSTVDRLRGDIL